MIQYRIFRNTDPPQMVEIWNDVCTGRGSFTLRNPSVLERWVFSKPYFDPNGLVVAEENGKLVGFAHAGFGPNQDHTWLSPDVGVVCAVVVRSSHQRRGIGSELLRHSEDYLLELGAKQLCAGGQTPFNPFYFGLYGGADSPGFLTSDSDAAAFLEYNGYAGWNTQLVLQRQLKQPIEVVDPRFNLLRRRYEMKMVGRSHVESWWQECLFGLLDPVEFRLDDKLGAEPVARALVWEMEGYSWRWNVPTAGLLDLQVRSSLRRQGLGKFLMVQFLKYLQDNYFGLVELHTSERNHAASGLFKAVGFTQVDAGRIYQKKRHD